VHLGLLDERKEGGVGRTELCRDLLGERDRDPETARGGDGELAPAEDGPAVCNGAYEHRLHVEAEEEGPLDGTGRTQGK
jgi:hypothetical protein